MPAKTQPFVGFVESISTRDRGDQWILPVLEPTVGLTRYSASQFQLRVLKFYNFAQPLRLSRTVLSLDIGPHTSWRFTTQDVASQINEGHPFSLQVFMRQKNASGIITE